MSKPSRKVMSDPQFNIPDIPDADVVFGGADQHLPKWADLPPDFRSMRGKFCDAASSLFYSGGTLSDHNLKFKDGVDRQRAARLIRALLGSFGPRHEHKIGGVGYLLSQWCDLERA